MPPVATFFVAFLAASLFVLFLIICVKAPESWRSCQRFLRQLEARKTRGERMLADLEKLKADARKLEGVYCFDNADHRAAASYNVESAASGAVNSSAPLR